LGVALDVLELAEAAPQLDVRILELAALLEELRGHVVERETERVDLVEPGGLDPLQELAARDGGRAFGEAAHGARDAARDERGGEAADDERGERDAEQLEPRAADLGFHAPLREPDAHRAPPLLIH